MKTTINLDLDNEIDSVRYAFLNHINHYHRFIDEVESHLMLAKCYQQPQHVSRIANIIDDIEESKIKCGIVELIIRWNELKSKSGSN